MVIEKEVQRREKTTDETLSIVGNPVLKSAAQWENFITRYFP